jgi:putative PIN family toxin of toxin-antitoxin system
MLKVVVDTNQFVSALINKKGQPARLLDLWRQQHFILVTCPEIIAEIKEVLEYPRIRKKYKLNKTDIQSLLHLIEHEAVVLPSSPTVHIIKEDIDDNKFLACALAAKAEYIVTGDQHLLSLGRYESISIVTVKDFLFNFLNV